jgi:hypothetical protein
MHGGGGPDGIRCGHRRTQINKGVPCITQPVQVKDLRSVAVPLLKFHVRDNELLGDQPAITLAMVVIERAWCPNNQ